MLGKLRYLCRLDVSANRLTELLDFNPPPFNLQEVDASRNDLRRIRDLSCHRFLRRLCLDHNRIVEISGLQECRSLTHLSMAYNEILSISGLEKLPLCFLDLSHNRIRRLSNIGTLQELEELRLGHNAISGLEALDPERHSLLAQLDLSANAVSSSGEQVDYLAALPALRHLRLDGNPAARGGAGYRVAITFRIPHLSTLDGLPLSAEEKVAALNKHAPPAYVVEALEHIDDVKTRTRQYAKIIEGDKRAQSSEFLGARRGTIGV